jgi:hypothetical protein
MPTPRPARSAPSTRTPPAPAPAPKARSPRTTAGPTGVVAPVRKARSTRSAPKLARASNHGAARPITGAREPDAVIKAATGRSWAQWFRLLDRFDVAEAGHSATVRHLADEHDCPRWWRQRIAGAYAEARGLLSPPARSLAANTSRTLSVSIDDLYRAWQGRAPGKWLQTKFKVHRANANRSLRLDWPDQHQRRDLLLGQGRAPQPGQRHAPPARDAAEVAAKKAFWSDALDKLQAILE